MFRHHDACGRLGVFFFSLDSLVRNVLENAHVVFAQQRERETYVVFRRAPKAKTVVARISYYNFVNCSEVRLATVLNFFRCLAQGFQ
jgi:hypothetical protein